MLKISEKEINKPFAAIIGLSPSKGARSPTLWNKVYKSLKKPIKMIPLDCKKQNIKKLFNELQKNKNYACYLLKFYWSPFDIQVLCAYVIRKLNCYLIALNFFNNSFSIFFMNYYLTNCNIAF